MKIVDWLYLGYTNNRVGWSNKNALFKKKQSRLFYRNLCNKLLWMYHQSGGCVLRRRYQAGYVIRLNKRVRTAIVWCCTVLYWVVLLDWKWTVWRHGGQGLRHLPLLSPQSQSHTSNLICDGVILWFHQTQLRSVPAVAWFWFWFCTGTKDHCNSAGTGTRSGCSVGSGEGCCNSCSIGSEDWAGGC